MPDDVVYIYDEISRCSAPHHNWAQLDHNTLICVSSMYRSINLYINMNLITLILLFIFKYAFSQAPVIPELRESKIKAINPLKGF